MNSGSKDRQLKLGLIQHSLSGLQKSNVRTEPCRSGTGRETESDETKICRVVIARNVDSWFDAFDNLVDTLKTRGTPPRAWTITALPTIHMAPVWSLFLVSFIYLLFAFYLTRHIKLREDIRSAGRALRRYPWLAVTPLLTWLLVANISIFILASWFGDSMVLPLGMSPNVGEQTLRQAMEIGLATTTAPWSLLNFILLAPIFEEALFRGWLYDRTNQLLPNWTNSLINAWFFMLVHVAVMLCGLLLGLVINPVQASPVLLPVSFALGLLFFWIRVKSQSLSLCILMHMIVNSVMLVGVVYLKDNWNHWPW